MNKSDEEKRRAKEELEVKHLKAAFMVLFWLCVAAMLFPGFRRWFLDFIFS